MQYLQEKFSVLAAGSNVTDEDWQRIFGPKPDEDADEDESGQLSS